MLLTLGNRTFTWSSGRQLKSISCESVPVFSFTYDENGIRTSKTYEGVTTYYTTEDGVITSQYELDNSGNKVNEIIFIYDNGELVSAYYQNTYYYYLTNLSGDVVWIIDDNGDPIVRYFYDSWGNVLTKQTTPYDTNDFGNLNPMRYRSYYYDGWDAYYLQSRYYLPVFSRFANADIPDIAKQSKDEINGLNLFAYCNNEPVNCFDYDGFVATTSKSVNLSNYNGNDIIIKFAKKVSKKWNYNTNSNSIKFKNPSGLGCELYIGASVGTSISALKSNVKKNSYETIITNKCSMSFGKYKVGFSSSLTVNNNTTKFALVVGAKSINYCMTIITKYPCSSNKNIYFAFDIGLKISQTIIKGAALATAAATICIASPAIVSAIAGIMTTVSQSLTLVQLSAVISTIVGGGLTVASKLI